MEIINLVCRLHEIHEPELARLRQLTSVYSVNNMLDYWQARKLCHTSWKIEWSQQLERYCNRKLPGRAPSPFQVISQNVKVCTKQQSSSSRLHSAPPIEWKSLTNLPTHNGRMEENPQSDSIFSLSNQLASPSRT